jgi:hypothetical protein
MRQREFIAGLGSAAAWPLATLTAIEMHLFQNESDFQGDAVFRDLAVLYLTL